ncbi:MAG TPA: serine/threonine-protein kinase [Gammaproteobacteria bacterium]|nr:serine/threonine-protein kinase [Gammaproteobacteria bacterium]
MKKGFWTADWFTGLAFSLLFGVAYIIAGNFFQSAETAFYDFSLRAAEAKPSPAIAVIEIDDESIANLGRWPWPRYLHAELIDRLKKGGAKVIGNTVFFSEAQQDSGLLYMRDLQQFFDKSSLAAVITPPVNPGADTPPLETQTNSKPTTDTATTADKPMTAGTNGDKTASAGLPGVNPDEPPVKPALPEHIRNDLRTLHNRITTAVTALDTDARLAQSMADAGNVVLPMLFKVGVPRGRPDQPPPAYVLNNAVFNIVPGANGAIEPLPTTDLLPPVPVLGKAAAGMGHLTIFQGPDGALRSDQLVLKYHDLYFPSLALVLAAKTLNLTPSDIQYTLGEGVQLGNFFIRTTPTGRMYNHFYQPADNEERAFSVDSFFDVLTGQVPADKFAGKTVLIGATAAGVGDSFATPIGPHMAPVLTLAHTVSAILQEDFYVRPSWAQVVGLALFVVLALYLMFIVPRLRAGLSALFTLILLVGLIGTEFGLMVSQSIWLPLMTAALFLIAGHVVMTIKRFRVTEHLQLRSEAEGAESNKMLGLAFQGQGQLDMAFEKFRKCPMEAGMSDLLYNLALDYERKRQHNKAGAVYAYIAEHEPNYRDIQKRLKRSKAMEETIVLGGSGGNTAAGTLIMDGDDIQKPMLGRYQVEKELGKGAMGVVYLGRDPKINRVVAIKTMALSQEFEADELEEVKSRFFREAETAGRLNHPHIVTIYDAGDEHDLAYIAMEFLKGQDLTLRTKPNSLLSPEDVFAIVADAAEALHYAHQQNVVHRDIKPANMMYEADKHSVKLTDFGIARITDSSKTKTGMVLGTPSYMSPEQLSGKKVDGRSDLFSLGVTFYQLLTGQLPFKADSMATLMYKIANEDHPSATAVNAQLPGCVDAIINKALAKDADKRYANGQEMANDIRACATRLNASAT